jgi:hypothetical protein
MHEPNIPVFVVAGVISSMLGPVLGPFVMLLFAAVMGGLLAMSRNATTTRWEGVKFLAFGVGISLVLTGIAVWALERYTAIPGNIALMPVAFFIAASRNSLLVLIEKSIDSAASYLPRKGDPL